MIIKYQFELINYGNVTIIIAHINTSHKLGKHVTILVIQLNEQWTRVSAEVLGQDRLGGKMHFIKKEMAKQKYSIPRISEVKAF